MIVNGVENHSPTPRSVAELLDDMGVSTRGIAVAVNGEIVRRSSWRETNIQPEDRVEIVTAVAGG